MENTVSQFLVSTCRFHTKFNVINIYLPLENYRWLGMSGTQTVCGSQAEFYIQPVNPCIDDIDILFNTDNHLAFDSSRCEIPEGVGNLSDLIVCSKLEAYEQNKSFVRLCDPICGAYAWNLEEYTFINIPVMSFMRRGSGQTTLTNLIEMFEDTTMFSNINERTIELNNVLFKMVTVNGPALKAMPISLLNARDLVLSVRCPIWPQVAEEWPKRRRYSGWPNSATISKVVHEGCDVVPVTHRDMREDLYQQRLSFSRAEVTLIQSWTPTQQIVYHLLRFFAKREIIRKNCPKREEVVCTYHLKTLMLWSCEKESTEWWEASSVIAICCKLCGKLCECLKHKHCPNYFIPEANLLDFELNSEILQQAIKTLHYFSDVDKMSQWFVMHYILPIYQELCNEDEILLTEGKIEICTISVCEYNERNLLNDLDDTIFMCVLRVLYALDLSYSLYWRYTYALRTASGEEPLKVFIDTTAVSKTHDTLADYMKALILFQMSQYMLSSKLQCDADLLSEIWIHIIRQTYFAESPNYSMTSLSVFDRSMLYFNRAEQIMKHLVFGYSKNESCFTKMVSILCLQKSLSCHDSSSCQTETASRLYLAALFYYTGHLQCTVQLCSQVATSFKEYDHCREVRNLKVNSLLFMDDLATIAGFLLLHKNILQISNTRIFLLSTELFVHYLFIQCNPERLEMKEKSRMTLKFEADCCLEAMMRYKILRRFDSKIQKNLIYRRCTEDAEKSTTDIVLPGKTDMAESLVRISNDYMTRFYDTLSEEYGSKFNLASCYKALSLYLCRRYEDVLLLCEKLLEQPEHDSELEEFQYLNVHVSFLFIEYFDEDIQTLVGFQLLVLHLSSMQDDDFENIFDDGMEWVTGLQFVDRYLKSLFPYIIYYEIFKPIFKRQFLGNYLKLRCLMDLGFPLFEVKSAFRCLESRFLFEHILLHFMREKIIRRYRATTTKGDVNRL